MTVASNNGRFPTIRVLSVIEADSITGPAKNMLRFACAARQSGDLGYSADLTFLTFYRGSRGSAAPETGFRSAARSAGLEVSFIRESGAWDPRIVNQIRKHICSVGPDIVQSHSTKSHFIMSLVVRNIRSKWIAFHHGYTSENLKVRAYNKLNRWSLPRADKVVTVCSPFAVELQREGVAPDRIRVLPNSIEPRTTVSAAERAAARAEFKVADDVAIVACVGRLSAEKGHRFVIEALGRRVPPSGRKTLLLLAGSGPDDASLRALVTQRGIRALFLGHRNDVSAVYAAADCFVLPSLSEGSPNALLEAMASSCPIVSTRVGGVPDMVTHEKEALLVQPGDINALGDAITRVISEVTLATSIREAARVRVADFTPTEYANRLLGIYADVMAAPVRGR